MLNTFKQKDIKRLKLKQKSYKNFYKIQNL